MGDMWVLSGYKNVDAIQILYRQNQTSIVWC